MRVAVRKLRHGHVLRGQLPTIAIDVYKRQVLDEAEQLTELLEARLDRDGKALLHRLSDAENEAGSTIALENFILGFRLGMRLTVEGLVGGDDSCLSDITEGV